MSRRTGGRPGGRPGNRPGNRGGNQPGGRDLSVTVRSARGRKTSSTRWLQRQLNDPYVAEAKRRGFRSRAAFKLLQLDQRFGLLRSGMRVIDLGCAPGGWTQVTADAVRPGGVVVGLDLLACEPVDGATLMELDFLDPTAPARLTDALGGAADLVLSDMAAPATGHAGTDHLRIMALAEAAHAFARTVLAPGGGFVCKLFQGGAERGLLDAVKQDFRGVRHAKPEASRSDSAETYLVATGFRGGT